MNDFFYRLPLGSEPEFSLLTFEHFFTVFICGIIIYGFYLISPKLMKWKHEPTLRYVFAILILLTQVVVFYYQYSDYNIWYMYFPIATCGWGIIFGAISLLTKNRIFTVLTFFYGWGAISTIAFPNLLEGPLRYNFYQFFFRHVMILISTIYMFRVHHFKLYKKDFLIYVYVTLPMALLGGVLSWVVNKPDTLNMFYMMKPANNTPVFDVIREYNYVIYVVLWLLFSIVIGYIYGLPFYQKNNKANPN